jgi:hypothetical protein
MVSTKFSITDNAVNQHASSLDTSVAALNSQASAFLTAIELPANWDGGKFRSQPGDDHDWCIQL